MTRHERHHEAGFSLLELLVAMMMTLIVSGAIYGLMTGGQNAFRREPELTERQQNIRIAMDLIVRDLEGAGVGLPPFIQAFSQNLDACAGCPNGGSPMGESNQVADELEIISNNDQKGNEPACDDPGSSINVRLVRGTSNVPIGAPVIIIFKDGTWAMRQVTGVQADNGGSGNCQNGQNHVRLQVSSGAADLTGMNNTPGNNQVCQPNAFGVGNCCKTCATIPDVQEISFAEVIRWRIRNDAAGVPELQRFSTALMAADVALATPPANPGWRTLVRGIEDLQVTYTQMNGAVSPPTTPGGAPPVVTGNYTSLVTGVQVTLWSRATGAQANMAGLRTSGRPGGPAAYRGSLTSITSPRAALTHIANQLTLASPSPSPAPAWQ